MSEKTTPANSIARPNLPQYSHVLEHETTGTGRQYVDTEGLWYPSVTTSLSRYQDKYCLWLSAWKERLGEEAANAIRDAASARGTAAHNDLEAKFTHKDHTITSPFAEIAYKDFFSKVELVSMEEPLMFQGDYEGNPVRVAGRYDALVKISKETFNFSNANYGLREGVYLVDLKTKDKTPRVDSLEAVFKNALQASAYYKMLTCRGENLKGFIVVYATVLKTKSYTRLIYFEPIVLDILWDKIMYPLLLDYHGYKEYNLAWMQSIHYACNTASSVFGVYSSCLHYLLEPCPSIS
jgi:hypothetical protein